MQRGGDLPCRQLGIETQLEDQLIFAGELLEIPANDNGDARRCFRAFDVDSRLRRRNRRGFIEAHGLASGASAEALCEQRELPSREARLLAQENLESLVERFLVAVQETLQRDGQRSEMTCI